MSLALFLHVVYNVHCLFICALLMYYRELCLWDTDDGLCIQTNVINGIHFALHVSTKLTHWFYCTYCIKYRHIAQSHGMELKTFYSTTHSTQNHCSANQNAWTLMVMPLPSSQLMHKPYRYYVQYILPILMNTCMKTTLCRL